MSPALTTEQQTAPKPIADLDLKPTARAHLEATLSTYTDLMYDLEAIQHQIDIERITIGKILDDAGIDKARAGDFALAWVRGSTSSRLVKEKLLAQGVTLAQIEAATVTRPKRDYFVIRDTRKKGGGSSEEE